MTKKIIVQDGGFEKAMRKFKKKVQESGLLDELRARQAYVKPTSKRKVAKELAKRRWKKHLKSEQLPKKLY